MKSAIFAGLLPLVAGTASLAQTNAIPADAKPASSNVPRVKFPQVDSDRRAYFRIGAPAANSISVSLPGGRGTKGDDGIWTIVTSPLAPGFHYYTVTVDGATVSDPASESYFGTGKMSSAIEVPSPGTAHEWQTWRRSLHEFAPLLFQNR